MSTPTIPPSEADVAGLPLLVPGTLPNAKHITAVAVARSLKVAQTVHQMLDNPKTRKAMILACEGRRFMPLKVWSQGILPMVLAAKLQELLRCPVFPCAHITPFQGHAIPYCRGIVILVPRPDLIAKYAATGGHQGMDCRITLEEMGSWEFFIHNLPTREESKDMEALVASKSVAQFLTIAGRVPETTGCYVNEDIDFPVPMVVNPDDPESGRYVGIITGQGLGLEADPLRPTTACPDIIADPYGHGEWLVAEDAWKVRVARRISELSHAEKRPDFVDIFFHEATAGSWTGEPYRDAPRLLADSLNLQPHMALSLEAEVWARWVRERQTAEAPGAGASLVLSSDPTDQENQISRLTAMAEVMKHHHDMTMSHTVKAGVASLLFMADQ